MEKSPSQFPTFFGVGEVGQIKLALAYDRLDRAMEEIEQTIRDGPTLEID